MKQRTSQVQSSEMDNAGAHITSNMDTENQTYPRQTTSFSKKENHLHHSPLNWRQTAPNIHQPPRFKERSKTRWEKSIHKIFHIKRIYADKHVLFRQYMPDINKAKEILIAVKTAFCAYTPKSEKYHTVLLEGLNNSFSGTKIVAELHAQQVSDVQFAKDWRFLTKRSIENNVLLLIHIIQVSSQINISNLLRMNRLNYFKVKRENIKKRDIMQYQKCKLYGAGRTKRVQSQKIRRGKKDRVHCVNCTNYGYAALYKECIKLVELCKKLRKNMNKCKESTTNALLKEAANLSR
jgi:hypothetical protein